MRELPAHEYFPADYDGARKAFAAAAGLLTNELGSGKSHSFRVPSKGDDHLYLDCLEAHARKEKKTLFVVSSGVHGLESFAGSAIQRMLLAEVFPKLDWDTTGIFVAHVLNPYGFKYKRRATENNVNLNRNFSASSDLFRTKNDGYRNYADFVKPSAKVGAPLLNCARIAAGFALEVGTGRQSSHHLIETLAQGQFEFADGIEFGGFRHEPQTEYFMSALANAAKDYRDIVVMDLHTGLGDRYQLHLIPGTNDRSVNPELRRRLLRSEEDADISAYSPQTSEGFYLTHGDLNNMIPDLLAKGQRCLGMTMEFGTLGSDTWAKLQSWNRLLLENQGHHHGYVSERARARVAEDFLRLSYPADLAWKESVIGKSRELFRRLIARIDEGRRAD